MKLGKKTASFITAISLTVLFALFYKYFPPKSETNSIVLKPTFGFKEPFSGFQSLTAISSWDKVNLTYTISKYSKKLENDVIDEVVKKSFEVWANYTNLTFRQKSKGAVDINIR